MSFSSRRVIKKKKKTREGVIHGGLGAVQIIQNSGQLTTWGQPQPPTGKFSDNSLVVMK